MTKFSSRLRLFPLIGIAGAFWSFGSFGASLPATQALAEPAAANLCPAWKAEYPLPYDPAIDALGTADLTKRANAGNADAMMLLGLRYTAPSDQDATLGSQPDLGKAVALFRKAAKKRQNHAEYLMGVAYMAGAGVDKDEKEAVKWFKRAADHGSPMATYWVGELNAKGRAGLTEDWATAARYFHTAAEKGIPDAFVELGHMYAEGISAPMDAEKAAFCFRQALTASTIASYNLRSLIDKRLVTWQQGDPGEPVKPEAL